ncbi:MAG: helix-turn-helix domain-containing protein [Dehalococcoidia bacterium]
MQRPRNIVGPRVREARRRITPRLTQAALAARLQVAGFNIDRAGIAKIECGYREVTDYELVALAKALAITATWLLDEGSIAATEEPAGRSGTS